MRAPAALSINLTYINLAILCLLTTGSFSTAAPLPQRIEVYPPKITLDSHRAYRQLVVTGYFDDVPRDLTTQATFVSSNANVANIIGTRTGAVSDGQASITVTVAGQSVQVPVVVSNTSNPDPVQFKFETTAVLTKQGCATGSCHGSPHGKGNFSLSLFGYDPAIDRISLTRDGFNRRVNVLEPAESLMLKKPLMELSHIGGKRLMKSDAAYRILYDWIYEGADTTLPAVECQQILIYPTPSRVLRAPFLKQQMSVLARYSDGSVRDVTTIVTYTTSNAAVAEVDAGGLVTGKSRGQAAISVRYLDKLESVYMTVIEDIAGFTWPNPVENNFVDCLIDAKLKELQYAPSNLCSDGVFVRRVYLDLTGLLATADETREFVADKAADKRSKLIDRLLETESFARTWAQKKAELMRVSTRALTDGRAGIFADWIIDAYRKNLPYDQFARKILTASGNTKSVPPANYYEAVPTMEERTEMTAEIFMGSRLECCKCHNHPFENWTMKDYYSLAAVFVRTRDENGEVTIAAAGEAMHPTSKQPMIPWGMPAKPHAEVAASDRRQIFADWLTTKGNPYFARVEVNRIWAELLGRGIVEPVDDFRSSNPPSNGPLLDALAGEFEKSGYDRKHIIRVICNSRTYQQSTQTSKLNEGDETLFSHAAVRLLSAEQLKDAIGMVSGSLAPPPVVEQRLIESRRDLQSRQAELETKYDAWLKDARQRAEEMPSWVGIWYSAGPFPFGGDPVKQAFGPEKHAVDLSEVFDKGQHPWRQRLEYADGSNKLALDGLRNVVNYLYCRVHSEEDRTANFQILCGNGALVWLNEDPVKPSPLKGSGLITLKLKAGDNRLLIKVIIRSSSEFSLVPKDDEGKKSRKPELPGHLVELLTSPVNALTDVQRKVIGEYYLLGDVKYRKLRDEIEKLESRSEYATQRAVPQSSAFMATFGQPQRQTACTCERSSSPTLLQALELLNGNTVAGMIGASSNTYAKLDDDKFLDELYLSAYSRLPTEHDRAAAKKSIEHAENRGNGIVDMVWAVVNTREFLFQH